MKKQDFANRLVSFLLLFTLSLITACSNDYKIGDYSKVESKRSNFVLGLVSYMTLGEVKEKLQFDERKIIVTDDSGNPKQEGIPPFNILTVKVLDTPIGEFNGTLTLTFFNDRLMEVRFYPVNVEAFVQSVDGLANSTSIDIEPYARVWLKKDYQGASYVGWVDIRLQQQFETWIKNYS